MLRQSVASRGSPRKNGSREVGRSRPFAAAASLLALACAVSVGSAHAEGLPDRRLKDFAEAHASREPYDWSGVYFGAHVGKAGADVDWGQPYNPFSHGEDGPVALSEGAKVNHSSDGWISGGHLGYNDHHHRSVFGFEASFSETDLTDASSHLAFEQDEAEHEIETNMVSVTSEMDGLFLATVRIGYTWDRWLGYLKGGYASARVKLRGMDEFAENEEGNELGLKTALTSSERHHGFTIGGGFEYALTNNVILGLEYNYIGLGSKTHGLATVTEFENGEGRNPEEYAVTVDPGAIHAIWARLSFKLNGDVAPLVPWK